MAAEKKLEKLRALLKGMGSVLVAYSGGVDSTFLLHVSREVLGDRAVAATAESETYPAHERETARRTASLLGAKHVSFRTSELDIKHFSENPPDRCYYCKKELFTKLKVLARKRGLKWVAEGSNSSDDSDFRPGRKAVCELGIRSPLKEAGLTKPEIRHLARKLDIPVWDKPSFACLSSRFPYGERITLKKVKAVEKGEDFLRKLGLKQFRLRHHGSIARIEVEKRDIGKLTAPRTRASIVKFMKKLGYKYVCVDLEGYRTGSMNEVLGRKLTGKETPQ